MHKIWGDISIGEEERHFIIAIYIMCLESKYGKKNLKINFIIKIVVIFTITVKLDKIYNLCNK